MEENHNETVETTVEQQSGPIFQENLPNANLVLTLGILSIILILCCCGPFALPLPIIGWVMGHKGVETYKQNPEAYTISSYSNMNAGRICSIVGIVLVVLVVASMFVYIFNVGGWDAYMETVRDAMEQAQNQ